MATLFSIVFTGLFIAFVVAAILGHLLLIEATFRPFVGKLAIATTPRRLKHLQPAR
jgi:hypothetical protein